MAGLRVSKTKGGRLEHDQLKLTQNVLVAPGLTRGGASFLNPSISLHNKKPWPGSSPG